ncbi:hypothetical protein K4K58_010207 [Colletotrichum sp. SAR11_239]|nr:hypothetical protein K4K51_004284 [Colletotrichum sp. SAR 10_75]KAI8266264.1 hypothetical protein K4K58_010207 [Colletotrichum sp. SAR11_239]
MPYEDRPHILAPHQPPGTFARLRAKALADRERKAKEEARKNNGEQQQKGEEQTKEASPSSSSAPKSKPGIHPSLLKPHPVFPGTMNIAILNDDWTLPLDQVDLKARRPPIPPHREVYLAREIAAWEQFQYEQEQQGREETSESATVSKDAANGGVETKGV